MKHRFMLGELLGFVERWLFLRIWDFLGSSKEVDIWPWVSNRGPRNYFAILTCQNFITKLCRVCLILGADISVLGVVFFLVQSSFFWHNLMQTRGLGSSFIWSHLDQDQRSWTKKKSLNIKSAPWNSVQ